MTDLPKNLFKREMIHAHLGWSYNVCRRCFMSFWHDKDGNIIGDVCFNVDSSFITLHDRASDIIISYEGDNVTRLIDYIINNYNAKFKWAKTNPYLGE